MLAVCRKATAALRAALGDKQETLQRPAIDSSSVAKSRHINPSVSRILALRGAPFHSPVRMPETVEVMIMKLWTIPAS